MKKKKICFASSSGGHYEQLMMLKPLMEKYDSFIVTEKTAYRAVGPGRKTYYLHQVNRKERLFPLRMAANTLKAVGIILRERPDAVISTGVLATIPLCLLIKAAGGKLIYIESFAKVKSATETGKLMYKFADQFYVQWETMKEVYPAALYLGGIY